MKQWFSEHEESCSCMYWPPHSPGLSLIEYLGCAGGDFTEWFDYPIVNAALDGNTFSDGA